MWDYGLFSNFWEGANIAVDKARRDLFFLAVWRLEPVMLCREGVEVRTHVSQIWEMTSRLAFRSR